MVYEMKGYKDKVLKLNKVLYGLKQTLRAWYSRIDGYFLKNRFIKCPNEYVIYIKIKERWYFYYVFVCGWLDLYRR